MEGIVEDIGNHAEGGAVDKTSSQKQQQEGCEEHGEMMDLDSREYNQTGCQHDKKGQQGNAGAAVDFIGQPAPKGADTGPDEGAEEGGHGEGDFRKSMDAEKFAPAIPMKETSNTKVS